MTLDNVVSGLVVCSARIRAYLLEELPFMATDNIIMKRVAHGASRQQAHEEIRVLSHQASHVVKGVVRMIWSTGSKRVVSLRLSEIILMACLIRKTSLVGVLSRLCVILVLMVRSPMH